jgi:hypothetical protein
MNIKPISKTQFESLMENLCDYICCGFSHNMDVPETQWDTLSFKYDGDSSLGLNFTLAHPYSRIKDAIDYDVIEIRFCRMAPFEQDWGFRITDKTQIKCLKEATFSVFEHYRKYGTCVSYSNKQIVQ